MSVVILIDTSLSQYNTLDNSKLAAKRFIESILQTGQDSIALVSVGSEATIEQDLTNDPNKLLTVVNGIRVKLTDGQILGGTPPILPSPIPGTAIWDAIWSVTDEILRSTQNTRRAIVLLSDGLDTSGRTEFSEAILFAAKNDVTIFPVGIGDERRYGLSRDKLKRIAEETGGRAFFPKKDGELYDILVRTAQDLRVPYLLTYCSAIPQAGSEDAKLKLRVTNKALKQSDLVLNYRRHSL